MKNTTTTAVPEFNLDDMFTVPWRTFLASLFEIENQATRKNIVAACIDARYRQFFSVDCFGTSIEITAMVPNSLYRRVVVRGKRNHVLFLLGRDWNRTNACFASDAFRTAPGLKLTFPDSLNRYLRKILDIIASATTESDMQDALLVLTAQALSSKKSERTRAVEASTSVIDLASFQAVEI